MPSIVTCSRCCVPRTVGGRLEERSVPPTSILLMTMPGTTRAIDQTSVRFGSASSSSRLMTVCFRAVGIQQRRVSRDDDAFFERPDWQFHVGARGAVGNDDDVRLLDGTESLQLRADAIGARHEPQKLIRASRVGHRLLIAADRSLGARQRDVTPGSTAPVSSVAVPEIAPTPCAVEGSAAPMTSNSTNNPLCTNGLARMISLLQPDANTLSRAKVR